MNDEGGEGRERVEGCDRDFGFQLQVLAHPETPEMSDAIPVLIAETSSAVTLLASRPDMPMVTSRVTWSTFVGSIVGRDVGAGEGTSVGRGLGSGDGGVVGSGLGATVGCGVGVLVG